MCLGWYLADDHKGLLGAKMIDLYWVRRSLVEKLTDFLIEMIRRLNPLKDEGLSYKLEGLADSYAKRPSLTTCWNTCNHCGKTTTETIDCPTCGTKLERKEQ